MLVMSTAKSHLSYTRVLRRNSRATSSAWLFWHVKKKKSTSARPVDGETARINEFRRESDRYRRDRKIQLFSFYFFTTQERFLTSVLIRGIKAITHVVSRLRASERASIRTNERTKQRTYERTNTRTSTLGLTLNYRRLGQRSRGGQLHRSQFVAQ